jgi:hypothetical protein
MSATSSTISDPHFVDAVARRVVESSTLRKRVAPTGADAPPR